MKIKIGDLLMNDFLQLGMVEDIGQLTNPTQRYWVRWYKADFEHWVSESSTIAYRNIYLRYRE